MIKIEKSRLGDIREIFKLSIIFDSSEITREEKIKQALKNSLVWVAKDGKKVVGYVLCQLFGKDHKELPNSVFVSDLFVLDSYRKQGIGRQLLQTVLANDFPVDYTHFSITYDPEEKNLTHFYQSFAFVVTGETQAGNVKMIKKR
ncbi:MAG TPA: GNAT family N-acetyltransferase [Patescibacteria group bacterium]|nr:GNAT family N-acetyltransferase [Patescibacteria group bacterium]